MERLKFNPQLNLFKETERIFPKPDIKPLTGDELKTMGMKRSEENANAKIENWSDKAYKFFLKYIENNKSFLVEDVRFASKNIVPEPPSLRAWGSVVTRASREGFILKLGYKTVMNPKAHSTPATLWIRKNNLTINNV